MVDIYGITVLPREWGQTARISVISVSKFSRLDLMILFIASNTASDGSVDHRIELLSINFVQ